MGAHLVGQPFADCPSEGFTVARQRAQRYGEHLDQALVDGGLQTHLRPEIMSDEPGRDACRLSDVTHRRPGDAPLGEQSNRGIPQPGTGGQVVCTRRDERFAHALRSRSSAVPESSNRVSNATSAPRKTGSALNIRCSVIRLYMILFNCIAAESFVATRPEGAITREHGHGCRLPRPQGGQYRNTRLMNCRPIPPCVGM